MAGVERGRRRPAEVVRAGDAPVPLGRAPHGPPEELLGRRRRRPLPPPQRPPRHAPDGLRRVRPPRREPRDQDRRAPARLDRRLDRGLPAPDARVGDLDRLVARVRHQRSALLPLDPVALPALPRARPRVPQGGRGQLVPQGRHRARQRAGHRRPLRALRHAGRGAPARAVVLPHHRLRRSPARRPRDDRLAAPRRHDAAQLDRPLRGRGGHVPVRGARHGLHRVHDAPGHPLRRDVLRDGARAPGRVPARRRDRARARRARVRQPRAERGPRRARATPSARRPASRSGARSSTPSTASRSRCTSPTTC